MLCVVEDVIGVIANLVVGIRANTSGLGKGLKKAQGMVGTFANSFGGAALAATGVGVAIGGVSAAALTAKSTIAGVITTTREFQQAMASSTAIMGELSASMRSDMKAAALDVAKTTKFSATEAAQSYFFLASAGLKASQTIEALPIVARFAQAGMFDMALATDLATDAQSALGLASKDNATHLNNLTRVTDVLVKANTLANASVEQFSKSLTTQAGAALRGVNKSIEEGVAVLAVFADQGIKGEEAGTKLAIVLRDLQTKALKQKAAFAEMGISVFDSAGQMKPMADIVGNLEDKLGGMSSAQKKATLLMLGFSDKSLGALTALMGTSEQLREYEKGLRSAGGTTADVAGKQMTPFEEALNRITASWDRIKLSIGEPLFVELGKAFEQVANSIEKVNIDAETMSSLFQAVGFVVKIQIKWWKFLINTFKVVRAGITTLVASTATAALKAAQVTESIINAIKPGKDVDLTSGLEALSDSLQSAAQDTRQSVADIFKPVKTDAIKQSVSDTANSVTEAGKKVSESAGDWAGLEETSEAAIVKAHELRSSLIDQIKTFGQTSEAIELNRLKLEGAADSQIKHIAVLQKHLAALKAQKKVLDELRTPVDTLRERMAGYRDLLQRGLITQQQFNDIASKTGQSLLNISPNSSPLQEYTKRVQELSLAWRQGSLSRANFKAGLQDAKAQFGIVPEVTPLQQYMARVRELSAALKQGTISQRDFTTGVAAAKKDILNIQPDVSPIGKLKKRFMDLRQQLALKIITPVEFKTAAMNALPDNVKDIIEKAKSPIEKFHEGMKELMQFRPLLNDKQFKSAVDNLKSGLDLQPKDIKLSSSLNVGSAEAREAVIKHQLGNLNPVADVDTKQLSESQKHTSLFERMLDKLGNAPTVEAPKVPPVNVPQMQPPRFNIPQMPPSPSVDVASPQVPQMPQPRFNLPDAPQMPTVNLASPQVPQMQAPPVNVASQEQPRFQLPNAPQMQAPTVNVSATQMQHPRFQLPQVEQPQFELPQQPTLNIPNIEPLFNMPRIEIPEPMILHEREMASREVRQPNVPRDFKAKDSFAKLEQLEQKQLDQLRLIPSLLKKIADKEETVVSL